MFGVHKPLETKANSVKKDLIVEKCKPNSSTAFWRLCFPALIFYEWCLGTVEVARMWKEQTVQCQKQIMWLQVSLLAHCSKSAASLQLEIPTWDIKLETVLCWKQWGGRGTAIHYSTGTLTFLRGLQEDKKPGLGMKLKQLRHLEASLQSTEKPEPEPAIDCMAAPWGLCQAPGTSRQLLAHQEWSPWGLGVQI